jgi:hypothetical protein
LAYCGRHSPICQRMLLDMPQSGKAMPSCSKIRRILRTTFYIDGCITLRTVALRRPIFKVCVTISSGLNFCSMGSSQPTILWHCPFNKNALLTIILILKEHADFPKPGEVALSWEKWRSFVISATGRLRLGRLLLNHCLNQPWETWHCDRIILS